MVENEIIKKVSYVGAFLSSLTATGLGVVEIDQYSFTEVLQTVDLPVVGTVDILLADALGSLVLLGGVAMSGILFGDWDMLPQLDKIIVSGGVLGFLAHAVSPSVQDFVAGNIAVQVSVVLLVTLATIALYRDDMSEPVMEQLVNFTN